MPGKCAMCVLAFSGLNGPVSELIRTATAVLTIHNHPVMIVGHSRGHDNAARPNCTYKQSSGSLQGHKGDLERLLMEGHPQLTETNLL